jgi:hypothetical protein
LDHLVSDCADASGKLTVLPEISRRCWPMLAMFAAGQSNF